MSLLQQVSARQLSMLQYRDLGFEFFADDEACVAARSRRGFSFTCTR